MVSPLIAPQSGQAQNLEPFRGVFNVEDLAFETLELSPNVYALLAQRKYATNSGFIVGDRGVLVIDAHIHEITARRIQEAIRAVTDKPILYLVNLNYFGDHWFGNYAFPAETQIIAHRRASEVMESEFEIQKENVSAPFMENPSILEEVVPRLPDVRIDERITLDLGGITVEIHHFGYGATEGDLVVYVPQAQVAWVGNFMVGNGVIPLMIGGNPQQYREAVNRFSITLDVGTIVPGHGHLVQAADYVPRYLAYLSELDLLVRASQQKGQTQEELIESIPLRSVYQPEAAYVPIAETYHFINVRNTFTMYSRGTK